MTIPNSQQYPHDGQMCNTQLSPTSPGNSGVKLVGEYALQERLGSGSFATVYKGVKVASSSQPTETVAIKAITRNSEKITKKVLENLELEISILRTYRHANIVCLKQVHKTERHFYLVLEYCAGGDLQHLIRSRKTGRVTERLARRLMRDLTAGLKFLWAQELIHRDIKPQNLLLTGPLPLDEVNDPSKSEAEEEERRKANFPTNSFHLKIADFGFARHLQTTSMADTLCGSPLYMAPEILQHKRYDAKADLWSAGTVLFEMIAGRPPFHGENHIDLLRNIQQKSVRLPPDVRLSNEGVKLLRLLLHRNPMSRAGFSDYIDASDAFVARGCNGVAAVDPIDSTYDTSMSYQNKARATNLGPISEVEESNTFGRASNTTVATHAIQTTDQQMKQQSKAPAKPNVPAIISPSLGPTKDPSSSNDKKIAGQQFAATSGDGQRRDDNGQQQQQMNEKQYSQFAPLEPSPPNQGLNPGGGPPPLSLGGTHPTAVSQSIATQHHEQIQHNYQRSSQHLLHPYRKIDSSQHSDDSGFVMVEANNSISSSASMRPDDNQNSWKQSSVRALQPSQSNSSQGSSTNSPTPRTNSPRYFANKISISSRNLIPPGIPFIRKGMLSTSPGTGGALVGAMGSPPAGEVQNVGQVNNTGRLDNFQNNKQVNFDVLAKMLAAAEDVARRAVNVAHVGDTRVYIAMKQILTNDSELSLLSATPMEGVEEDQSEAAVSCESYKGLDEASDSLYPGGRARTVSTDRSFGRNMKQNAEDSDDEDDEMPFAVSQADDVDQTMAPAISRPNNSSHMGSNPNVVKDANSPPLQSYFHEALSCYIKALSMLKGSINGSQRVAKELQNYSLSTGQRSPIMQQMEQRCEISRTWIADQFKSVLERADAANTEIAKAQTNEQSGGEQIAQKKDGPITSVEELIYNHSLACGRDGAVKQLLGQYDASRSSYRSAGLLAETLLMEEKLGEEDRKILDEYVQGFMERITELDAMKQSVGQSVSGSETAIVGPLSKMRGGVRM